MEFEVVIKKDGTVVAEVLDRGEHLCTEIYRVTAQMGRQLSDEELPDNSQPVHNTVED